ncbi:hypothetical protein BH09SUM1_BH09SUM1_23470 [soil metagenome]
MITLEEIKKGIDALPFEQVRGLSDWIEAKVNGSPEEIEAAWLDLVEDRYKEYKAGRMETVPAAEMDQMLREKYGV